MKKTTPINDDISARHIRVIDTEGNQLGILSKTDALKKASESNLDLVQMSTDGDLAVARIMDYGKFLFSKRKLQSQSKSKQNRVQVKEVKLRPSTGVGDQQTKLHTIRQFLESGDKVRLTVRFRGREVVHPELGEKILQTMVDKLADLSKVEQKITMEGRRMGVLIVPTVKPKQKTQKKVVNNETEVKNA